MCNRKRGYKGGMYMETMSINVPSASCSICSEKIKKEIGALNGVNDVTVDLKTQNVNVVYDSATISPEKITGTIISMGYEIV